MDLLQLGPAGGTGGKRFEGYSIPDGARVTAVHIYTDWVIDALGFDFVLADGTAGSLPPIGGLGGQHFMFQLQDGEYLTGISGLYGWYVDAIRFHTNQRTSELFGGEGGIYDFEFKAPDGYEVTGLFGRADWYIDAIGLFARPVALREELAEGLALATETEAERTAEAAEEALDAVFAKVAAEIEAELAAGHSATAEALPDEGSAHHALAGSRTSGAAESETGASDGAELIDEITAEIAGEVEAELLAEEEEAILAAVVESVVASEPESEVVEEAWLSVGDSEPVEASVAVRREMVADQTTLDELEEAVMAEAIAAYDTSGLRREMAGTEGSVDITLYTQIVEDEATGAPLATVMAVATDPAVSMPGGDQPDEAAVMVTDNITGEGDLEAMEEEAVDGAILSLMEDHETISEDLDVTIFTAIGNDQRTGETFGAVVAIAGQVQAQPPTKQPRSKAGKAAKKAKASLSAASQSEPRSADLQKIEGIGPKIAELLIQHGISDLAELSRTPVERLREILASGGTRFNRADPATWPEQAALGAAGDLAGLKAWQDRLRGGRSA